MANYATLKAAIADVVKTNGEQEITGANLQSVLLSIVNSIGAEYTFAGVATPSTSAGTPDQNVFYIGGAGTYANFGTSITVENGHIGVFRYNGSWTNSSVDTGIRDELMRVNKGFYIDRNHLMNSDGGVMSYRESTSWDCAIIFVEGCSRLTLHGVEIANTTYRFFSSPDIFDGGEVQSYFLDNNRTGNVPDGAAVCIVNLVHTDYSSGYDEFYLDRLNDVRDENMEVNKGYYIDKSHIMSITIASSISLYNHNSSWDCAIIFLEGASSITLEGVDFSSTSYRFYSSSDIFGGDNVYSSYLGNNTTGAVPDGAVVCIVNLSKANYPNGYDELYLIRDYGAVRKKIRMLLIGNSATDDALSYVPFIMQNMGVGFTYQIGILMRSSATLQTHVNNFSNESAVYGFRLYNGGSSWSVSTEGANGCTIQWALDNYEWDIISLQQAQPQKVNTYQPYCNELINLITDYIDYPVKFIWYQTHIFSATANGEAPRSEETIAEFYGSEMTACTDVISNTVCEYIVPVSTAIQNARSVPSIKAIGDYANNPNNTTGYGYLNANDGVHLQEGLPCQIAAYTFILSILDIYGMKEYSINAESTRVTSSWVSGKNIPSPHGSPTGSNDTNCLIAQKCAIMAIKKPYEMTDMNYIINPT